MGSNLLIPTTGGDVVVLVAGTPTNGQAITWDAATARNVYSTISGGTPGGSNTQIQFNNAGVFGGSANLTWDGSSMLVVGLFRTSTIDPTGFSGSGIDTPGTIGAIGVGSTIEREAGVVGLAFKAAMKAANIDCGCSGRKNDYDARFPY